MTWFLVLSLGWTCPGGWLGGFLPAPARPLVCKPALRREAYDQLQQAQDRVRALGPDAVPVITQVRGLRLHDLPLAWETTAKF